MNAHARPHNFHLTPAAMFGALERAISQIDTGSYPPFNVVRLDTHEFQIELAVAGFTEEQVSISVEKDQLTIEGKIEDAEGRDYLHKGIAQRAFKRAFRLGQHVRVSGASMTNGLLAISLKREIPEAELPKTIEITKH